MSSAGGSGARLRVLLVDDEPDNVALLTRILHGTYAVDSANSGEEALEKLQQGNYDIIITDQRMSGMSGTEFLVASTERAPNAVRIIVSAYSDFEAILDAINVAGASGFLRKPVTSGMLESAISRAVTAKARSQQTARLVDELEQKNRELEQRLRGLEAIVAKAPR